MIDTDVHFCREPTAAMLQYHTEHRARQARLRTVHERVMAMAGPILVEVVPLPDLEPPGPDYGPLTRQIETALKKIETVRAEKHIGPEVHVIQVTVAKFYGVALDHMLGSRRTVECTAPRMVAIYLSYLLCPHLSLPLLGKFFGGRDHTTILHSVRKITGLVVTNERLAGEIEVLLKRLRPKAVVRY